MRTINSLLVASGLLVLPTAVPAADSYLCVTDAVAGLAFNKTTKQWYPTTFVPSGKYIVSVPVAGLGKMAGWKLEVKETGAQFPISGCKEGFDEKGFLKCSAGLQQFEMNSRDLRFQRIYPIGYVGISQMDCRIGFNDPPKPCTEGDDTPTIAIGKCSPL